ncbi:ribonuclease HI [Collimonas sp. OK607]|uniref:RNase H family protein n=1 Tax=Collimonas sp. OK607 TaxID=1798194 RepID=UPI0008E17F79|nr:RNase H family protein [Collimonas sp. OK607]SFB27877.1 ribonuclease HI [Collimonas sp. OK607]
MHTQYYTDGSVLHLFGCGGYAAIRMDEGGLFDHEHAITGSMQSRDVQEMELRAVIAAARSAPKKDKITIYTDHKAISDAMSRPTRAKVEKNQNSKLWYQLRQLCTTRDITVRWVKGHSGDPGNSAADRLARAAAKSLKILLN